MSRSHPHLAGSDASFQARRVVTFVARLLPGLAALCALLLVARGDLRAFAGVERGQMLCLLFIAATLIGALSRRIHRSILGRALTLRDDIETGALLIGAAFLTVQLLGEELFPLVYLLMAFLVAFLPTRAGLALVAIALFFDGFHSLWAEGWGKFCGHAVFLVLFAALYRLVLAAQLSQGKANERAAVDRRIKEVEERARAYRLISSGSDDSGGEDFEAWLLASVREVEGAVGSAIEVAEVALRTHTCAAFVLTSDDRALKLHDCRSASDFIRRDAFPSGEGVLGGVLKKRAAVRLSGAFKGVNYYEEVPALGSLLAVPIIEAHGGGALRGVLVADRASGPDARPFSEDDEKILTIVASEVLRAIEVERLLTYFKRARDEKDRLYRAIEELNRTTKTLDALSVALDRAREMARLDFAALTLVSEEGGKRRHQVMRSTARELEGMAFADNSGLVSNVIRYGAALPGRDVGQMDKQIIFDEGTQVRGLKALKILPLCASNRIVGTLVAGSRLKKSFDDETIRTLEVLAMQAAQSVLRASLFEKMEQMATTDGLTGLLNHRTFQSRFDEALSLAQRYEKKLSFMLTDIDHFKSVNDTYGHPVGDVVLKGVARILRNSARDTDVVARYGGEEFCVIMPETDEAGAKVIAERIRTEVQAAVFDTELGPLKITMSLGIATYPENGTKKQQLIDLADGCLYFAKEHGRNQSVTVAERSKGGLRGATA